MYGWILDGISSLFEHVTENNPIVWPGKGNVSEGVHTRPGVKAGSGQQENHARPAKRKCQSVDDSIYNSDQVEVKRRRRDVVISFVKKTLVGVAGLLRLRNPLTTRCEKPTHYKETQPITLVGIDELHTSWLTTSEWRMNKPVGGMTDRGGKNLFQSSSPPLMRKYRDVGCLPSNISVNVQNLSDSSRAGLSAGSLDRGKDFERRGPVQLLPSRPVLRMGGAADSTSSSLGQCRFYKPSLTVEEAIKQNNKEHYRRLLEMVTEKYSKNQPLPFNQTKPQDESLSQSDLKTAAPRNSFESVSRKTGFTAAPHVFTWKNTPTNKDRRGSLPFSKTFSGIFEDTLPSKCTKKQSAEVDLSAEVATRLNLMDRETPAVSPPDIHSAHSRHSGDDIPQLTREMAAEVSSALAQSDPNLVLSSAFKLRITQRDLATLHDGGWLNDEVINFYLSLIMERSAGQATELKVYSFSTFFFPKLWGGGGGKVGGHDAVKRWTKAIDLFSYDLILVPLHLGIHWAMAVIDLKSKNVMSYDSLGQRHDEICSLLLLYLKEEHRVKKGRELDSTKWTNGGLRPAEIPQQKNGSDCGVFACKYADYIAKGRPLTFKQYHMPVFRKLMIWEILNQKLL